MEALTKALEDLKAAEARFHDLLDPVGHMAKSTQVLAVATAETVLASIAEISEAITKIEAPIKASLVVFEALNERVSVLEKAVRSIARAPAIQSDVTLPEPEKPSAAAPAPAPAAPVPQEAAPAAEAPQSPASG